MNNYDFYAGHSDSVKKLEGGCGELCAKLFYLDVKKNSNIDYIITNREKRRLV